MPEEDSSQVPSSNMSGHSPERSTSRLSRLLSRAAGILALIAIAFLAGWFSHQYFSNQFDQNNQSQAYAQLIQQAWNTIDQNYVDRQQVDYKKMSYAAIDAMAKSLNDKGHTRFLTPQDVQAEKQGLSGKFTGIGIYLHQDPNTKKLIITAPIPGSPADKAGLQHDDVITAVNGVSTAGKDVNGVSSQIQGAAGTTVTITVQRPGESQPLTFKITRAEIRAPNVIMHYIPESHTAHIQIVQFADGVSNQLKDAIVQAKKQGATSIILDLRDNPGGLLDEAQQTASLFLKQGSTILITQNKDGTRQEVKTNGTPLDTQIRLVVLINQNSASAAEIVSGALKDNHRATIIGSDHTFGTGTVLQEYDLSDGSAILLGIQEWLTPSGQFIRDKGITPDAGHVVNMGAKNQPLTPTDENASKLSQEQILKSSDLQLIKALQYLSGQK